MQNTVNTTRTNRYGIDLNSIRPYSANPAYVADVIARLQETKQNLPSKDLAHLFSDDIGKSYHDLYVDSFELDILKCISNKHGLYVDNEIAEIRRIILDFVSPIVALDTYYYTMLVLYVDMPSKSTLNPKKLAVWRNTSKMTSLATRQAVSVRKWIGSTLVGLNSEQQETLAVIIDRYLQGDMLDKLDVRFANSSQFNLWRDAYESDKIRSCMHPLSNCEVGKERTYRSYCTAHYGLPDNGLQLAILYQDDLPVARAITFSDDGNKCFVSSYGDDRLYKWLKANGYNQVAGYPERTILWAGDNYMKPYVDGSVTEANHCYDTEANTYYWRLCECDGDFYERDVLDEYDLKELDGEVYHIDDLWKCELTDEHFTRDGVFTSADEISTAQPVYFPYDCVSREYWHENVVECTCGTLALERDTSDFYNGSLGSFRMLDTHYSFAVMTNKAGQHFRVYPLHLDVIERHCDMLDDEVKAEQYLTLCREYERIQSLMAQELGI